MFPSDFKASEGDKNTNDYEQILSSLFIGLVIIGSISIQDGRGLFSDMGETVNLISSNTDSTANLSTKCRGKGDCFDGKEPT
jgi:hypothetical protein